MNPYLVEAEDGRKSVVLAKCERMAFRLGFRDLGSPIRYVRLPFSQEEVVEWVNTLSVT